MACSLLRKEDEVIYGIIVVFIMEFVYGLFKMNETMPTTSPFLRPILVTIFTLIRVFVWYIILFLSVYEWGIHAAFAVFLLIVWLFQMTYVFPKVKDWANVYVLQFAEKKASRGTNS